MCLAVTYARKKSLCEGELRQILEESDTWQLNGLLEEEHHRQSNTKVLRIRVRRRLVTFEDEQVSQYNWRKSYKERSYWCWDLIDNQVLDMLESISHVWTLDTIANNIESYWTIFLKKKKRDPILKGS